MLNENRAWVMSILKNSESSKKIDCVINTVETASRLIVHAIKILDPSVLKVTSGKAVSLISYFCSNILICERSHIWTFIYCNNMGKLNPYKLLLII